MRLLHARSDLFRRRLDEGRPGEDCGRDPRVDEREHLPVWRVSKHSGGDSAGDEGRREHQAVNSFSYARASDVRSAVQEVAADQTTTFIAGGTNLIDLMKE